MPLYRVPLENIPPLFVGRSLTRPIEAGKLLRPYPQQNLLGESGSWVFATPWIPQALIYAMRAPEAHTNFFVRLNGQNYTGILYIVPEEGCPPPHCEGYLCEVEKFGFHNVIFRGQLDDSDPWEDISREWANPDPARVLSVKRVNMVEAMQLGMQVFTVPYHRVKSIVSFRGAQKAFPLADISVENDMLYMTETLADNTKIKRIITGDGGIEIDSKLKGDPEYALLDFLSRGVIEWHNGASIYDSLNIPRPQNLSPYGASNRKNVLARISQRTVAAMRDLAQLRATSG